MATSNQCNRSTNTNSPPGSQFFSLERIELTNSPDTNMPKAATKKGGKAEKRGKGKKGMFPLFFALVFEFALTIL